MQKLQKIFGCCFGDNTEDQSKSQLEIKRVLDDMSGMEQNPNDESMIPQNISIDEESQDGRNKTKDKRYKKPNIAKLSNPDIGISIPQLEIQNSITGEEIQNITQDIIDANLKMHIEIVESGTLEERSTIQINASGRIDSKRKANDGCCYFGTRQIVNEDESQIENDLIVPNMEQGFGGRHFVIKFVITRSAYFIMNLGEGTGTFIRLDQPLTLEEEEKYIISYGETHMLLSQSLGTSNQEINQLNIQFLEGTRSDELHKFTVNDTPITIGRMETSTIRFRESTTLSRQQCKIEYIEGKWKLSDGDGNKHSTNGTWLLVEKPFQMFNNMTFKAGQTLFSAHLDNS